MFAGCSDGSIYEISMKHCEVVRNFGNIFSSQNNVDVESMTATIDNKSLFVCNNFSMSTL